jgi:LL-diaminopimelate aminotransferase
MNPLSRVPRGRYVNPEGAVLEKRRVVISASERVTRLPPYLFAEIDRLRSSMLKRGVDLIDFGIGDPDLPTPANVVKAATDTLKVPAWHRYPKNAGSDFFLEAVAGWMSREFSVDLGEDLACAALIGSKEGLAHVPMVFCNSGSIVLVPNPGYPVYRAAGILADAVPVDVPLLRARGFLPDLESIDPAALKAARVIYLNYPNNPTGAVMTLDEMKSIVEFARREDILIVSDNSYSHIRFDGQRPLSFLQVQGAGKVCLEFHSLSKTFNMTGWRVGFVVGGRDLVKAFSAAKENIDSGVFTAIQKAAAEALSAPPGGLAERLAIYAGRRRILAEGLAKLGWDVCPSPGSLYLWVAVPKGYSSMDFAARLISSAAVVVTPGSGFGSWGEGYIRFALTVGEEGINKALGRLEKLELLGLRSRNPVGRSRRCRKES